MKRILVTLLAIVMCMSLFFAATAEEKINLTFQYIGGTVPYQDEAINNAIAAYEELNPNVNVEPVYVGWGNGHSQFYSSVMAGSPPDIAMLGSTWCVEFIEMGTMAKITDYVSDELLSTFIPSGFDVMKDGEGNIFGLPWDGCTWGLVVRTDILEDAGVETIPTNWDELLVAAERIKAIGKYTLTVACSGWEVDDYYLPFLWQAGGEVSVRDENGKWVSAMGTDESIAAAEFYTKLVNDGYMPKEITGMDFEAVLNSFVAGDTAFMVAGMWNIGTLKGMEDMNGKWTTARMWGGPARQAVLSYPNTLHITELSKNKEEAGKFIEFFYNEGYYDDYCMRSGVFAFTNNFRNSEYAQDEFLAPFILDAEFGHNRPATSKYEEFRTLYLNPGVQSMVSGEITPDEFCEKMVEAFNMLHAD